MVFMVQPLHNFTVSLFVNYMNFREVPSKIPCLVDRHAMPQQRELGKNITRQFAQVLAIFKIKGLF